MKLPYVLKTKNELIFPLILITIGVTVCCFISGFNVYILLAASSALIIIGINILNKSSMMFYSDKITFSKGFANKSQFYDFKYSSIDAVYISFETRGGSSFSFKIKEDIYEKRINYNISDNFETADDIEAFVIFLHEKGISIYCHEEDYLSKIFRKDKVIDTKSSFLSPWFCVNGKEA